MAADRPAESEGVDLPRRRLLSEGRLATLDADRTLALVLVLLVGLLTLGVIEVPRVVPISILFPLTVVAGLLLSPRWLWPVLAAVTVSILLWLPNSGVSVARNVGVLVSMALVMALAVVIARSRAQLGTRGFSGDRMFAELRDRIASSGAVPALPAGWSATSCILSAHGDRFSGDFVLVHLDPSRQRLEFALVDVSGKGTRAGTRSLLLSGALGGLLGNVPSTDFLRAANDYLVRQGWEEGFATAVHVDLDLRSGDYSVANAGHPSPARYTSGRARWTVLDSARGPLLGVIPDVTFPRQTGSLGRGDALLIYSDGVVEARDRDLTDGIDRMLGVAAMSVLKDSDVARDVCEASRSGEDDDRAAFAVRRR